MTLTAVEVGKMIEGYERVATVVRKEFFEVMHDFPACSDIKARRREFLTYIDQMQEADIDKFNLERYRQLCLAVENLYDLATALRVK